MTTATPILPITGTFLDEISHDIPHQNWGRAEWERDFAHMKAMGIDTVILIRLGYRRFITYPSEYLLRANGAYLPPLDLVQMFLELAGQYGMKFYFGLYDSGRYWDTGDMRHEITANRYVIDEVWERYGHMPAFAGWYLSMELSRRTQGAAESISQLGRQCKDVSSGLPTFISPWIDGHKALLANNPQLTRAEQISLSEHEQEWNEILSVAEGALDAVAFQDGHVDYAALPEFLHLNKELCSRHGMSCWTNAESFDRDMPIKFLPIKWQKLHMKLQAAYQAGCDKAITFEFSHFMSPQSMYASAGHLYNRYLESLETDGNR